VPDEPTRANQLELIKAGCKLTFGTDSMPPMYEDVVGYNRFFPDMGIGTVDALEGLVLALGMTPSEAIVIATRNAAEAVGLLESVGTVEVGKAADLLLLDADPTADITNIRTLSTVIRDGVCIDPRSLPVEPKFYVR
jgi:imidazolonepropionase-like amidohydrolase